MSGTARAPPSRIVVTVTILAVLVGLGFVIGATAVGASASVEETPTGIEDDPLAADLLEAGYPLGDVTTTGEVTQADVELIQRAINDPEILDEPLPAELADLTRDGDITLTDAVLAMKLSSGADVGSTLLIDPDVVQPQQDGSSVQQTILLRNEGDIGAIDRIDYHLTADDHVVAEGSFAVDVPAIQTGDNTQLVTFEFDELPIAEYTLHIQGTDDETQIDFAVEPEILDPSPEELIESGYELGDVRHTGSVDDEDAVSISRYAAGELPLGPIFNAGLADITRSGEVTDYDAELAWRLAAGAEYGPNPALEATVGPRTFASNSVTVTLDITNDGEVGLLDTVEYRLVGPVDSAGEEIVDIPSAWTDSNTDAVHVRFDALPPGEYTFAAQLGDAQAETTFEVDGPVLHPVNRR